MEHYGSMDALRDAFDTYVGNIPFYGFGVLCTDHPEVAAMVARVSDRRIITYGYNRQADVRAVNLQPTAEGVTFDVMIRAQINASERVVEQVFLPMAGEHNVSNALAAIAVAVELGATNEQLRDSLKAFGGVKRRFTAIGEWNGIKLIDDYAHHPVEIAACLRAARAIQGQGRVIAISQPHRFSRLNDLFEDFAQCYREADIAVITPVFGAGEEPIEGVDHTALVNSMLGHGHKHARVLEDLETLPALIQEIAEPGDMVVCMGAGSISTYANDLIEALES